MASTICCAASGGGSSSSTHASLPKSLTARGFISPEMIVSAATSFLNCIKPDTSREECAARIKTLLTIKDSSDTTDSLDVKVAGIFFQIAFEKSLSSSTMENHEVLKAQLNSVFDLLPEIKDSFGNAKDAQSLSLTLIACDGTKETLQVPILMLYEVPLLGDLITPIARGGAGDAGRQAWEYALPAPFTLKNFREYLSFYQREALDSEDLKAFCQMLKLCDYLGDEKTSQTLSTVFITALPPDLNFSNLNHFNTIIHTLGNSNVSIQLINAILSKLIQHAIQTDALEKLIEVVAKFKIEGMPGLTLIDSPKTKLADLLQLLPLTISLSGDRITDEILMNLARFFPKMIHLNLKNCPHVTNKGLAHLSKLSLTTLDLSGCTEINDDALALLTGMPLTSLNLSGCKRITHAGLAHLTGMNLTSLDLSGCTEINDDALAFFSKMPLSRLILSGCNRITDAGLAHLTGMPLIILDLSECKEITAIGLGHLSNMPLTSFKLSRAKGTIGQGLIHFKKMPLKELSLFDCEINDADLDHLIGLPISELNLGLCYNIGDEGVKYISQLPLTILALDGCYRVTNKGVEHLQKLSLISLSLGGCQITNDALAFLSKMTRLTRLSLRECGEITDAGLEHLKDLKLQVLSLSLTKVAGSGFTYLSEMPLFYLDLGFCYGITAPSLEFLSNLPLRHLNLTSCFKINNAGLDYLKKLPLTHLYLGGCYETTSEGLINNLKDMPLIELTLDTSGWGEGHDAARVYFSNVCVN